MRLERAAGRLKMTHQPVTTIAFDAGYDTHEDKIRYDACVTVDETFLPQGDIGVQTIAGGVYGVTTHFGPYAKLNETYAKLMGQWLTRSGYEARSSPCFEV